MGDPYYEPLKTMAGKKLVGRVAFADPVSDVAVLTDTDDANKKKLEEFENFRDDTEPLPLCSDDFLKKHAEERTDDGGSWRYRCGNNCPRPHLGGFARSQSRGPADRYLFSVGRGGSSSPSSVPKHFRPCRRFQTRSEVLCPPLSC